MPRSQGGATALSNLALSCPGCNLAKGERTTGEDDSGRTHALFNPRNYKPWLLGWHLHFALNRESGLVVAQTQTGEATIATLGMNGAIRVFARQLQIRVGLIS